MINMATLLGRVGKKDTKQLRNGGDVTIVSIATTKKYKDAQGQNQEQTTWHNVNCFSKLSEIAQKYVQIGDLVWIFGEIQNKKIEGGEKDGQYIYSIHAREIKFIPSGKKTNETPNGNKKSQSSFGEFDDSEIPF